MRRLALLGAGALYAYGRYGAAGVTVCGVALVTVYLVSVRLKRWVACPVCRGKPRKRGWLFGYAWSYCRRCAGKGEVARWGSRAFVRDKP